MTDGPVPSGSYRCTRCGSVLALYASFSALTDRSALQELGWRQERGGWRCARCRALEVPDQAPAPKSTTPDAGTGRQ